MKTTSTLLLSSALLFALGGCSTISIPHAGAPQNEAGETAGKAAAAPAPTCKNIGDIDSKTTPPDIYEDMRQCALNGDYDKGVTLFALAGTYTFYDALRVEDGSAFSMRTALLRDSLNSLDAPRKKAFKEAIKGALGNDEKRGSICKEVMHAGPPDYYPAYMVVQGENGAAIAKEKGGLSASFDSNAAWKDALNRFLHCS